MPKARINISTREADLLPPPPGKGGFSNVYRWDGERIWRTKVGRQHYAYRSMPGMEGWVEVDSEEAYLVSGEIMVPDQLEEMGIPIPPGGTYADVYMLKNERALRAATCAGDWFLVNPQQGWFCAAPAPEQQASAQAVNSAVRAGLIDLPLVEERPDEQCSVRIQNMRRMIREREGRAP
jgi:hypothetical protein